MSRIITWTLNAERIRKSKGFDVFNRWLGEQHELNMFSVYKSGNWFLILGSKKNSISRLSGNYRTPFPDINSHKPQLLDLGFWIRHVSWLLPSSGFIRVHLTSIVDLYSNRPTYRGFTRVQRTWIVLNRLWQSSLTFCLLLQWVALEDPPPRFLDFRYPRTITQR